MPFVWYESIAVTASASGDITAYSTGVFTGFLLAVSHSAATGLSTDNVPWSTNASFSLAGEKGLTVLETSQASSGWTYYPHHVVDLSTGTSTGTGELSARSFEQFPLAQERLVVTITSNASTAGAVGEAVKVWIGG